MKYVKLDVCTIIVLITHHLCNHIQGGKNMKLFTKKTALFSLVILMISVIVLNVRATPAANTTAIAADIDDDDIQEEVESESDVDDGIETPETDTPETEVDDDNVEEEVESEQDDDVDEPESSVTTPDLDDIEEEVESESELDDADEAPVTG